jgi:hypothetical protein
MEEEREREKEPDLVPKIQELARNMLEKDGYSYRVNKSIINDAKKSLYFVCSSRKSKSCKVTKIIEIIDEDMIIKSKGSHSHDPPSRQHISNEVKYAIESMAKMHLGTSAIQHNLASQFPSSNIGTKSQVKYIKNSSFSLPSGWYFLKFYFIFIILIIIIIKEKILLKSSKLEKGLLENCHCYPTGYPICA